jgi:hypothetical protein
MKLRPNANAHSASHCLRCEVPLTEAMGQVRAICSPCDLALQTLHQMQEYTLYGRTYYRCSLEGTSYAWLMSNPQYSKDVGEVAMPTKRGLLLTASKLVDQAALENA